jgi:4-diphosphocytidyl-2-C-methyl-D-erythritol kinase
VSGPRRAATGPLSEARAVQLPAQAKINLRLRILAREDTGFHQLETLFLRLELADTVRVRRSAARSLDVAGAGAGAGAVGPRERNLAWRAAVAYADAARWRGGFAIELEKRIPIGGGLGGGSADAGAVLRALDALSPAPLGPTALHRLAAGLGADVPFLTGTRAYALAWGRGERMLALQPPSARDVVLAIPPFAVDTGEAYGWLAASRGAGSPTDDTSEPLEPASLSDWNTLAPLAVNDFEPVVAAHHPEIARLVRALRAAGCTPALMSGSGSTVVGVLPGGGAAPPDLGQGVVTLLTRTATRVEPVSAVE